MRRILRILVACILVSSLGVSVSLALGSNEMQPHYVALTTIRPEVTISGMRAVCTDMVKVKQGYSATTTWSFQYQSNRSWIPVASWNQSNQNPMTLNKTVAVVSGRTYRLQTVVTVYNVSGVAVETVTKVSDPVRT